MRQLDLFPISGTDHSQLRKYHDMCRFQRDQVANLSYAMADAQSKPSSPELKVQPEGMEQEADLLAKLAEVPSISKAWITSSPYPVHLITVC